MSDLVLRTATSTQMRLSMMAGLVRKLAARLADDERGQDAIEYVGVLVIVAVVIGAVATVITKVAPGLTGDVGKAIDNIFKQ
jgi:Flp pilus assembly pilin Flp